MKILRVFLPAVVAASLLSATLPPQLTGKSGANLKNAVAAVSRPAALVSDPRDFFAAVYGMKVPDLFNGCELTSSEAVAVTVAPDYWWRLEQQMFATYGDTTRLDLHNLLAGSHEVTSLKSCFPPAMPSRVIFDNGLWQTGRLAIDGMEVDVWCPPAALRGDVARALFYMAVAYPVHLWDPYASLVFTDGDVWPGLTPFAMTTLLEWHRADPVDDIERRRNDAAAISQGNRNLFVDFPELAELLWGNRQGEPFEPDDPAEPVPLHSRYSLSQPRIDLVSPLVPDDARWSADGRPVDGAWITPAALGSGRHRLSYETASETGFVIIIIEP